MPARLSRALDLLEVFAHPGYRLVNLPGDLQAVIGAFKKMSDFAPVVCWIAFKAAGS